MLFAPAGYYAYAARMGLTAIDWNLRADKRFKAAHRYDIADTRGRLALTVPVTHLSGGLTWNQVMVSDHGQWWHKHRISLESAYGRTPYFAFYYDRFKPLLTNPLHSPFDTVGAMIAEADRLVRRILLLPSAAGTTAQIQPMTCRTSDGPVSATPDHTLAGAADFMLAAPGPYRQIRDAEQGFHPNLSILDLIFNLGPESAIIIRQ